MALSMEWSVSAWRRVASRLAWANVERFCWTSATVLGLSVIVWILSVRVKGGPLGPPGWVGLEVALLDVFGKLLRELGDSLEGEVDAVIG